MNKLNSENRTRLIQIVVAMLFFVLPFVGAIFLLNQEEAVPRHPGSPSGVAVRELAIGIQAHGCVIYTAGDEGIFRSDDGVYWQIINDGLPLALLRGITVKTLAVDPRNSALVYALVSNSENAVELYRTINSGDNWERLTLPSSEIFSTLVLSAGEPPALYLLSSDGLYVSYDDGQSWTWRNIIPQNIQAQTLAVDPHSPGILYLGTQGQGILRSVDEGRSWTYIQDDLDGQPVQQLLVSPANPRILFALAEQKLYRSLDAGQTWELVGQELQTQQIITLAAHPERESIIYVGTAQGQVFVTANTGETWTALDSLPRNTLVQTLALDQSVVQTATNDGLQMLNLELSPDVTPVTAVAVPPTKTPTSTSPTPTGVIRAIAFGKSAPTWRQKSDVFSAESPTRPSFQTIFRERNRENG